jgi:hypothetical protein
VLDISLAGLIGAIAGTFVAGVSYHLSIGAVDRWMRERAQSQTAEERDRAETTMSLMRRIVLTTDLLLFAGLGYWIGNRFWG